MRAPDTLSRIERACRLAGETPKTTRARAERRIVQLLKSEDNVTRTDLRAVADYLRGELDRAAAQGRPFDPWQHHANDTLDTLVRDVRHELGCTYKEAVVIAFERFAIDDPDGRRARATLKRLTR